MSKPTLAAMGTDRIPSHTLETEWHIASVVMHCQPEHLLSVKAWLGDSAEVHAEDPQGKLVLVLETQTPQKILDFIDSAQQQPHIINAALVYHEIIASEETI